MKKVYVVTSGSYSDYTINAIFTTKQKAEEFMDTVSDGDYNDIQEFELDVSVADLLKQGYSIWCILMLKDGTVEKAEMRDVDKFNVSTIGSNIWKRASAPAYRNKGIPDVLLSTVWAKNEKHAIKIANEHRIQLIADGQWT